MPSAAYVVPVREINKPPRTPKKGKPGETPTRQLPERPLGLRDNGRADLSPTVPLPVRGMTFQ